MPVDGNGGLRQKAGKRKSGLPAGYASVWHNVGWADDCMGRDLLIGNRFHTFPYLLHPGSRAISAFTPPGVHAGGTKPTNYPLGYQSRTMGFLRQPILWPYGPSNPFYASNVRDLLQITF
jgi:hypothetical protein